MDSPGESGPRSLPGPARPSLARGYSSGIGPHPGPRGQRWLESAPASLTPQGVGVRREEGSPLGDIGCLVQRLLGAISSLLLLLPHTQTRSCSRVAGTVRGSRVARSGGDVGSLGSRGSACGVSVLETAEPQSFPAERGRGAAMPSRLFPPPAGRGCPLPRRRLAGGAGHGPVWSIQVPPPVCGGPSPLAFLIRSSALCCPRWSPGPRARGVAAAGPAGCGVGLGAGRVGADRGELLFHHFPDCGARAQASWDCQSHPASVGAEPRAHDFDS